MANGRMTKHMDMVLISMQTEQPMLEIGKMTNNMGRVLKLGPMVPNMRANTQRARSMERVPSHSPTEACIGVTSSTMKFLGKENMSGLMANNMTASGTRIRCMALAHCSGKTAKSMRDTSSMIRERARASLLGKMAEFTTECGKTESSTERANLLLKMAKKGSENGIMDGK